MDDGVIEKRVIELIGLAIDESFPSQYATARQFIVAQWRADPQVCKAVLIESTNVWDARPLLVDDVLMSAIELNDDRYVAVLQECSELTSVGLETQSRIKSFLVREGMQDTIGEFASKFRQTVHRVIEGRVNPDRVDFESHIKEVCRLRLSTLLPELRQLKALHETASKYVFDLPTKMYVDAAVEWFTNGLDRMWQIACDTRAPIEYRSACVFCLGCGSGPEIVSTLIPIYKEKSSRWTFDLRLACVESLVYAGAIDEVDAFVNQSLRKLSTARNLKARRYYADIGLLLEAAYNMPRISPQLQKAVEYWLDARNKRLAARALLALEQHGFQDARRRDQLGYDYAVCRETSRGTPSPLMLMAFRRNPVVRSSRE